MSFLDWLGKNLLGVVALFSAVTAPIVTVIQIWRTSKVQMKQIRPQVISHGCRVSNLDVYTYFDEKNKISEPACVFLSSDGKCLFEPKDRHDDQKLQDFSQRMLAINKNKCYLSIWGRKIK